MTEVTDRNDRRAEVAAGGWSIAWGDLINEWDVVELIISAFIPTGSVAIWVSQQTEAQLQKFQQSLRDVSDDVVNQATKYLTDLLQNKRSGEWEIDGLGVKAGIVTYHRHMKLPFGVKTPLPNNHQPYIGLRVTKPLPPKGAPATAESGSMDGKSWYKIKNATKPGMALDVVNDGNQQHDGRVQMAADGNFSGQYWQFRPSKTSPGAYNLCTMWLGTKMFLDVYGDDKTRPHLAAAGNFSGQQWHVISQGNGAWKLSNSYSGSLVLAVDENGSQLHLINSQASPTAQWNLQLMRSITESGFEL
ncbi:hypothetical protein N7474_004983 [Penicillium riverlandense]|uniref:uncharacterized protein n=1 Tax=Penicillium riverlandense TaxID=1903569 RepID=UPI00254981AA|nr:uncharacterized protein N7474_004983 [Penicillium riverlandense]KAJ5819392.1 hypothetical protein N7474_004983 [Penicillium riverlandense]